MTSIKLHNGLAGTETDADDNKHILIHPADLEIETDCFFPPSEGITLNGNPISDSQADTVGIQMVGDTIDNYHNQRHPGFTLTIEKDGSPMNFTLNEDYAISGSLKVVLVRKSVPAALWTPANTLGVAKEIDPTSPNLLPDVPKGLRISAVPALAVGGLSIDKANLEFDLTEGKNLQIAASPRISKGDKQTKAVVTNAMINHLPQPDILNALGITDTPLFPRLNDIDLEAVPYLVG